MEPQAPQSFEPGFRSAQETCEDQGEEGTTTWKTTAIQHLCNYRIVSAINMYIYIYTYMYMYMNMTEHIHRHTCAHLRCLYKYTYNSYCLYSIFQAPFCQSIGLPSSSRTPKSGGSAEVLRLQIHLYRPSRLQPESGCFLSGIFMGAEDQIFLLGRN